MLFLRCDIPVVPPE